MVPPPPDSMPPGGATRSLAGRVALVTGANSGLGFECAAGLAQAGATVALACRSLERGQAAIEALRERAPRADFALFGLDLSDLSSVRDCAAAVREDFERVDLLCNNAGVMGLPHGRTAQGHELHLGINHLGHVALTARLWPALMRSAAPRVLAVSSLTHRLASTPLERWGAPENYDPLRAYAISKLASLSFAIELDRRASARGLSLRSVAAHPGYAATSLLARPEGEGRLPLIRSLVRAGDRLVAQSAEQGARPLLAALLSPDPPAPAYFGPRGPLELRGKAAPARVSRRARDPDFARALWGWSLAGLGEDAGALADL